MEGQHTATREYHIRLFEEFPALIWVSGVDGKCNYFNKCWLNFTGRSMEDELGDGWLENVHPADRVRCMETYVAAFAVREPFEMEYRMRRHDGEYRWIVDFGGAIFDLDGNFTGYMGSCYDITERKESEGKLRRSEERHRQLVKNAPLGIIVCDTQGNITHANQKSVEIAGVSTLDKMLQINVLEYAPLMKAGITDIIPPMPQKR